MKHKNRTVVVVLLFALVLLATVLFFDDIGNNKERSLKKIYDRTCITGIEAKIVRGTSLSGLINEGATVKIFFGYYNCNEVRRGDIVVYNYSGDPNPIIKIAKGLPGDEFHLQKSAGGWNLVINDEIIKNSQNQIYTFSEQGHKMLSLYENDYKAVIPVDAYLLLGNLASGSLDSTRFGLVGKTDILGKVELAK